MINWKWITTENRNYDPDNFSLKIYCGALNAMGIEFVHRPVEEVLQALEKEALKTVNEIHRWSYRYESPEKNLPEEKTPEECLNYCLEMKKKPPIQMGTPNGASYSMRRVTAHFIGRCYEFALDIMKAEKH